MRSLSGFNNGAVQGSTDNSILNKMGASIDMASTQMSNDIQYVEGTTGTSYSLPQQVYTGPTMATPWTPSDEGDGKFSLVPGTINSLIPCVGGTGSSTKLATATPRPKCPYDWSATDDQGYQSCYIYLQASPAPGSGGRVWPSADFTLSAYPTVFGYPYTMEDDDDTGYVLLALAKKRINPGEPDDGNISFTQFVFTSLWSERHKYSQPDSAYYYYYRA